MQAIWDIVQRGPAPWQEMVHRLANKDDTFRAFKKMNNKIINRAVGIEGTPEIRYAEDIPFVFSCFVWLLPCCSDSSHISDMYNESHVAGILFCKLAFLATAETAQDHEPVGVVDLLPDISEVHMESCPIAELSIDELMLLTACTQHFWKKVVAYDNTFQLLFLLCARFGQFLIYNNIAGSASSEHLEPTNDTDNILRVRKKTTRTFLCTVLVMFRSLTLHHSSTLMRNTALADEERNSFLKVQCYSEEKRTQMRISPEVHANIMRIKALRGANGCGDGVETMQGFDLWKYISARMPEDAIGKPPRRISDEMELLLRNVCVFQEASGPYFDKHVCLDECAMVLKTALRYFYISPAVETFKKLSLIAAVCPGQRLTYAFDFVHFDTGQMSQVVFLHNPTYKESKPPQTVSDWDADDVCGPIAAFMSFDPTLQVWLEDSEDPCGILGHERQITRPAEHEKVEDDDEEPRPKQGRFAFVLNKQGVFLVDRQTSQIYTAQPSPRDQHHHVLYLICLFVFLTGKIQDVCKVAINSFKLCGKVGAKA